MPERMNLEPSSAIITAPAALKRLGEIQSSFGTLGGTQRSHVRVGGYLQNRLSTRHHKKREEKESVDPHRGGGNK